MLFEDFGDNLKILRDFFFYLVLNSLISQQQIKVNDSLV